MKSGYASLKHRPGLGKRVAGLAGDLLEIIIRQVQRGQRLRLKAVGQAVHAQADAQRQTDGVGDMDQGGQRGSRPALRAARGGSARR